MPQTSTGSSAETRQTIRSRMRSQRRALSPHAQDQAARELDKLLGRQPLFQRSRHIAFYRAADGEIDPHRLLQSALHRKKRCYLPALHPSQSGKLKFIQFNGLTPLESNRYGIAEPPMGSGRCMPANQLDLVLLPLVAFDFQGARLGMGAGFYDRTFAFKAGQGRQSPILVGLAHGCQGVPSLPVEPWDVPLTAIATESGLIVCDGRAHGRDFLRRDLLRHD
ncbi:MAG: 5-formyltetrahydrofolate cyclo-ligase [Cellvibrionaceae bacterium]